MNYIIVYNTKYLNFPGQLPVKETIHQEPVVGFFLSDIEYLKTVLPPTTEPEFFQYMENLTTKDVTVWAIDEGTVVFPKVPLLRIEGPLAVVQLLETTLLTLVNYAR